MSIEIREAKTPKEINAYIKFAWKIYRTDPELNKQWVPHPIADYEKTLDQSRYPLWEHADRACFTAWRNGEMVGTITAVQNKRHNEFHQDKIGFWGFFECINDQTVANALFDAAKAWLKSKGLDAMRGPISPSQNDQMGMLTLGFDSPPVFLMLYNPPYYNDLAKGYGHHTEQELVAWYIDQSIIDRPRLRRISDLVKKREKITIRHLNMKDYENERKKILIIYNQAWEKNWGFVPFTEKEFYGLADDLKQVADPDFVYIVENEKGEPIGFSLSLPDMNLALKHVNGNPFTPWGLIKFLWYSQVKKITFLRTITMGVIPSYRNKGIDAVMNSEIVEVALTKGVFASEMSWVLKSNVAMAKVADAMGGRPYKEYAI
ncbi:MAG: GNAT family N-acetyltransferase, partial [Rhizobacter sp.]|nr:GNAT family N-acetyltransferase [Chlorobiales bacterium]